MSVSFDSEEWFTCDGPVRERFECVEPEENSCALDDDEELVSDRASAWVPECRLEVDPPSESPKTSALRLLFMAGRVTFDEEAEQVDEDKGFDAVEVDFGLGMLEAEGIFEVDAALLPPEVEAGLEELVDVDAGPGTVEPTGTVTPVDLRLPISSLRPSTPAALELILRLNPLGPGRSTTGRSLTLLLSPPGPDPGIDPTFLNRTVLISFRNAAILSLGTLTVGCLTLPLADLVRSFVLAVVLASVGRKAARALAKRALLSPG